jgi:hypothetical protein
VLALCRVIDLFLAGLTPDQLSAQFDLDLAQGRCATG